VTSWRDSARLDAALREDPESVWPELRRLWCEDDPPSEDYLFRMALLEDLLDLHVERFIDRLEELGNGCPQAALYLADAHTGDLAPSPAMDRFDALQRRLEDDLVAKGLLFVYRGPPIPFDPDPTAED
jgi:hypothetical protein